MQVLGNSKSYLPHGHCNTKASAADVSAEHAVPWPAHLSCQLGSRKTACAIAPAASGRSKAFQVSDQRYTITQGMSHPQSGPIPCILPSNPNP